MHPVSKRPTWQVSVSALQVGPLIHPRDGGRAYFSPSRSRRREGFLGCELLTTSSLRRLQGATSESSSCNFTSLAGRAETVNMKSVLFVNEEGNVKEDVQCEECGEKKAKYRCPGCGLRSCGLPCVKAHKDRSQCTGKRDRTKFVSMGDFDDNWLISDYNFLEESLRQADAARRLRAPLSGGKSDMSPAMKALQKQARNRCVTLKFMPFGMTKRKRNTSFYERRTKRIFWRIEWIFEGTEVRLANDRIDENLSLETVLARHLAGGVVDVMVKHRLRRFSEENVQSLKFLLPKEFCSVTERTYYDINGTNSLSSQLTKKCIIEFPVIHVLLPGDAIKYVISLEPKSACKEADEGSHPNASQKGIDNYVFNPSRVSVYAEPAGVPFQEEDIEEGEFVPD